MNYAKHISAKNTPQSQPLFGKKQVKNNAGGYVYSIDNFSQLRRFLILGNQGGSYYCSEQKMTLENAKCIQDCAANNLQKTLDIIVSIAMGNIAPKKDPSIFALAVLMIDHANEARKHVNTICKTATDLFHFVDYCNQLRGWGKGLRNAVANWYTSKTPSTLAYQVTKYQQRDGWSHRDVLRLCHAKPNSPEINEIFRYVCQREQWAKEHSNEYLQAVELMKSADSKMASQLIAEHNLVREHVPTHLLNDETVWNALLPKMPATALLRNLGKLSTMSILKPLSRQSIDICNKLTDINYMRGIHPYAVLLAIKNYSAGGGWRSSSSWSVNNQVVDALNKAYNNAFSQVPATNKRFYIGIDVSGSMSSPILNSNISCREAAAALAQSIVYVEPYTYTAGFCSHMVNLNIGKTDSLQSILSKTAALPFGNTDCAQPMLDALNKKIEVECFIILTDNETWCGRVHPSEALKQYRQKMGIDAKLIVVGMTATNFSIADPKDAGMLDVVGFDSTIPSLITEFVGGNILR